MVHADFPCRKSVIHLVLLTILCLSGCDILTQLASDLGFPKQYSGRVYVLGEISGELADEIQGQVIPLTPYDGTSTDAPIVLAGPALDDGTGTLSNELKAALPGIRATFKANHPIIIVNATSAQIVASLHTELGLDLSFSWPTGYTYAEIYAIDLEPDGHCFQWVEYPPVTSDEVEAEDGHANQVIRANGLVDWMNENNQRMKENAAQKPAVQTAQSTNNDLATLTSAFVTQTNFTLRGNRYQVEHTLYPCHSADTNEDWFYVQQKCVCLLSGAYHGKVKRESLMTGGDLAYFYARKIEMNAAVVGGSNSSSVAVVQSSPNTTGDVRAVESKIDWSLSGNVIYGSDAASAGSVSDGVSVNDAQSVTVDGAYVRNLSSEYSAEWAYEFDECTYAGTRIDYPSITYGMITDPPYPSRTEIRPFNQWVWRMTPDVRADKAPMQVSVNVTLAQSQGVPDLVGGHVQTTLVNGGRMIWPVHFPYPVTGTE